MVSGKISISKQEGFRAFESSQGKKNFLRNRTEKKKMMSQHLLQYKSVFPPMKVIVCCLTIFYSRKHVIFGVILLLFLLALMLLSYTGNWRYRDAAVFSQRSNPMHANDIRALVEKGPSSRNLKLFPYAKFLTVIIFSSPSNEYKRQVIRSTWVLKLRKSMEGNVNVMFLLGEASTHELVRRNCDERRKYNDIVFYNFTDSYYNLTIKSICMLQWLTSSRLHRTGFVMKVDDDVFVNVDELLRLLSTFGTKSSSFIAGHKEMNSRPFRDAGSKWFVSYDAFPGDKYPPFITGPAYVFPARISPDIFFESVSRTYLNVEDVFITGICARALNVSLLHHPGFRVYPILFGINCLLKTSVVLHPVSPKTMLELDLASQQPCTVLDAFTCSFSKMLQYFIDWRMIISY